MGVMFTNLANELGHHLVWNFEMISLERHITSDAFKNKIPDERWNQCFFFRKKCEISWKHSYYPHGKLTVCELENGPVEIVDLPSYKMVDLSIAMLVIARGYPKGGLEHVLKQPKLGTSVDRPWPSHLVGQKSRNSKVHWIPLLIPPFNNGHF